MAATGEAITDLSVIIPAVNGPEILIECLDALRTNIEAGITLEILVIERAGEEVGHAVPPSAPELVVITAPPRTTIPQMRAIGFQRARAAVVAVIEDHIVVPSNWAKQVLRAFAAGADVVGGSVYNVSTATTVDWAAFLCDYSHLLAPKAGRDVEQLTGTNVAYRRVLVARYSALLDEGRWEDHFHQALRRDGIALMCVPEIAVGHKMHYRMKDFVSQRYLYSRGFAGGNSSHLTSFKRALGIIRSIVLPPVLLGRIVRQVFASNRHHRELFKSLPLLMVFVCAWAAGEAVGYAAGPGDSLARVR